MAATGLVLWLLTALYAVNGQDVLHLRDNGVYNDETTTAVQELTLDGDANLCFNGDTIYVADTNYADDGSTSTDIISFPLSGDGGTTTIVTLETGLVSLACCCRYYAYGYQSGVDYYMMLQPQDTTAQRVEYSFPNSDSNIATIKLDCEAETLTVVTDERIQRYSFESNVLVSTVYLSQSLPSGPRCVAQFQNGGDDYLAVSYEDRDSFDLIAMTEDGDGNFPTSSHYIEVSDNRLKISCVSADGDTVYFFARSTNPRKGYLLSDTTSAVRALEAEAGLSFTSAGFTLNSLGEFVNGLQVCSDCSTMTCLEGDTNTCDACDSDPTFADCGFCSPDGETCLCGNPETAGCTYDDDATRDSCQRPTPKLDALCAVLNPLAARRSGGPNGVAAVISQSEAADVQSAVIARRVKTGRWPVEINPRWNEIPTGGEVLEGFETMVQPDARGRRYGFFQARFTRTDTTHENIFCITTESSAFVNQRFTYVAVEGSPITLEVELGNQFLSEVRWMRTSLVDGETVILEGTEGSLTYTIDSATKSIDEGVYEAFRRRRYLRTWHPIIDLHVRECELDEFGLGNALNPTPCMGTCPSCVHGTCDVVTGTCRCVPGATGELCDELCSSRNLIGQNCDIDCDDIFPGAAGNDCVGLLLCQHEGMGCHCAPGLKSPACSEECDEGTYGPGCLGMCNGCEDCHPVTGCPEV